MGGHDSQRRSVSVLDTVCWSVSVLDTACRSVSVLDTVCLLLLTFLVTCPGLPCAALHLKDVASSPAVSMTTATNSVTNQSLTTTSKRNTTSGVFKTTSRPDVTNDFSITATSQENVTSDFPAVTTPDVTDHFSITTTSQEYTTPDATDVTMTTPTSPATTLPPPDPIIHVNATSVMTRCSANVTLPPASSGHPLTLLLQLPAMSGAVTCSWLLPAPDDVKTSHVFRFHETHTRADCSAHPLVSLYTPWEALLHVVFADSCSAAPHWNFPSLPGWAMPLSYTSFDSINTTTPTIVTLGTYSTFTWAPSVCVSDARSVVARVTNGSEVQSVDFPGQDLMTPPDEECFWTFRNPDPKGQVKLTVRSHRDNSSTYRCDGRNFLEIDDVAWAGAVRVPVCDVPSDFVYVSLESDVTVGVSGGMVASPGFSIGYSAVPANRTCPASPLRLQAEVGVSSWFKGANPALSSGSDARRECAWELSSAASPGTVVRLDEIFADDYTRHGCPGVFNDSVTLPGGQTLSLCDASWRMPLWSANQTLLFRFNPSTGSRGNRFYVKYTAVQKSECQGFPTMLPVATEHAQTASGYPPNTTSENSDCRWLLRTESSDLVVEAHVTIMPQPNTDCTNSQASVYDGKVVTHTYIVPSSTSEDGCTGVYTSHGDTMLLTAQPSDVMEVTITYRAVARPKPQPQPGEADCVTSSKLVLALCCVALLTFLKT